MEIEVNLKPSREWMGNFAKQFGAEAQSPNKFHYVDNQSIFRLNSLRFDNDTVILIGDINWSRPLNTLKTPLNTNEYWTLIFIDSEDNHINYLLSDNKKEEIRSKRTILMYNSKMLVDTHWPIGKRSRFVSISFRQEWLQEKLDLRGNAQPNADRIKGMLLSEAPAFVQGINSLVYSDILDTLFEDTNPLIWQLKVQAYSYELLADFISGIEKVGHWEKGNSKLRSADIKKVMEIESQYFNPLTSLPNIGMVAREAGMSLSKFKKCFKEIYGTPPYVYHLNQKLEVAKQYLLKKKEPVSEIASLLGYTSTANFDKAFKKKFKKTPSSIQNSA